MAERDTTHRPRNLTSTLALVAAAIAAALALGACSATGATGAAGPSGGGDVSFDPNAPALLAHGLQFDTDELDVPSDQAFDLVLHNEDGVAHNVSIYSDEGHTQRIFTGDLVTTGTHVYHVPALTSGTYYFQCDVHPQMKGIVVAAQG